MRAVNTGSVDGVCSGAEVLKQYLIDRVCDSVFVMTVQYAAKTSSNVSTQAAVYQRH